MGKLNDQRELNRALLKFVDELIWKLPMVWKLPMGWSISAYSRFREIQLNHKKAIDNLKETVTIRKELRPYFWQTWGKKLKYWVFEKDFVFCSNDSFLIFFLSLALFLIILNVIIFLVNVIQIPLTN